MRPSSPRGPETEVRRQSPYPLAPCASGAFTRAWRRGRSGLLRPHAQHSARRATAASRRARAPVVTAPPACRHRPAEREHGATGPPHPECRRPVCLTGSGDRAFDGQLCCAVPMLAVSAILLLAPQGDAPPPVPLNLAVLR